VSRDIVPLSSPYRSAPVPVGEPPDPLCAAERIAVRLLLGWALLRVGVCSLDPEGFIALVIVVTAVKSLARSLA
jgi:hypothetical protein